MKLSTGQTYETTFQYSQQQVDAFIEITGDDNPVHHDHEFAAQTIFRKPIMHGFLSASIFSKIFGTEFPGNGTIYLSQSMEFLRPMYVDQPYKAVVEVAELFPEKHRGRLSTIITDADGQQTVRGEAFIYHREKI